MKPVDLDDLRYYAKVSRDRGWICTADLIDAAIAEIEFHRGQKSLYLEAEFRRQLPGSRRRRDELED